MVAVFADGAALTHGHVTRDEHRRWVLGAIGLHLREQKE